MSAQVKFAVCEKINSPLVFKTAKLDKLKDDEILIRMVASGICHTDIAVIHGQLPVPLPIVLGHEGAGIVENTGAAVTNVKTGDRVIMSFDSCGQCPTCDDQAPTYCYNFFAHNFSGARADGTNPIRSDEKLHGNFFGQSSFASHAIAHARNVVKVPQSANKIPLEQLAPIGCGLMTGAGAILRSLNIKPNKAIAIYGTGAVGLAAIMAAKIRGASPIIAIDINGDRLKLAEKLGATHCLNAQIDVSEQIQEIAPQGLAYGFDTTGLNTVIQNAFKLLAPKGVLGIVGASAPDDNLTFNETEFMGGGRTVKGILGGDSDINNFLIELIELHVSGQFPFEILIKYFEFEKINDAIAASESGEVVKPIIRISDE